MSDSVIVERRGAIAIVTLNLPNKRNAISPVLHRALAHTLEELQDDLSLRAIVLTGGRHFCAGGDLGDLEDSTLKTRQEVQQGQRIVRALIGGRLPVVAAVEGTAFGAGFSIAMACDFVVVDENTCFGAAFGRVGLMPDYGLLWTLPARIGNALAREILLFCEPIKGEQAKKWHIADYLVEPGTVLEAAVALAERISMLPSGSVAAVKSALARQPMGLDAMLAWEADTQALLSGTTDFAEGVKAFIERRPLNSRDSEAI